PRRPHSSPTRRSSDLGGPPPPARVAGAAPAVLPAAVVVEAGAAAHQWDDEIAWVRGLAETHAHLRGMVAAVDYTAPDLHERLGRDRKSTRLNSSHVKI